MVGDLGHLGAHTLLHVLADGAGPRLLLQRQHRFAHRFVHGEADGELEPPLSEGVEELMGATGGVGPGQHPLAVLGVDLLCSHRELSKGGVEDCDVVGRGVRPRIAGPQHAGHRVIRRVDEAQQRMEAEAELVGGLRLFRLS